MGILIVKDYNYTEAFTCRERLFGMIKTLLCCASTFMLPSVLFAQQCNVSWVTLASTPLSPSHIPQGLAIDGEDLIISVYNERQTPYVRFFRTHKDEVVWKELTGDPRRLLHTSGIVPYRSDLFFLIDYDTGIIALTVFSESTYEILAEWDTGRSNISSGFIYREEDQDFLMVSTFGLRGQYHAYKILDLTGNNVRALEEFTLSAGSFIQGTKSIYNEHFLEARNLIGRDTIDIYRISNRDTFLVSNLPFPGRMIEDVAITDGVVYSTDESDFVLYRSTSINHCLR